MYCGHCGTENPDGSAFCRACGARLEQARPGEPRANETRPGEPRANETRTNETRPKGPSRKKNTTIMILLLIAVGVLSILIGLVAANIGKGEKENAPTASEASQSVAAEGDKKADQKKETEADSKAQSESETETDSKADEKEDPEADSKADKKEDPETDSKADKKAEAENTDKTEAPAVNTVNPADLLDAAIDAYIAKISSSSRDSRYALVHINGDVLPELVISDGSFHMAVPKVYTYTSEGLTELEDAGSDYGTFCYAPEQNLIISSGFGNGGYESARYMKMEDGRTKIFKTFKSDPDGNYEVDGKKVSSKEYKAQMKEADADYTIVSIGYDDMFLSSNSGKLSEMRIWYNNFVLN